MSKLKHISISTDQLIELTGSEESSVAQVMFDAVKFMMENNLPQVDLTYKGFLFCLTPDSEPVEIIKEFLNYELKQ